MNFITVGKRRIGAGAPAYIIAEMSANHAGSMENAKEIIFAAKESGADCIKLQTYTPDTITMNCSSEYFQIASGTWAKENLYELYQKAYTPWEWQAELKETAARAGIDFLSTPFDCTAVDFLEEIGLEFYKIGSFELVDIPLLKYVAQTHKPIIMSTGMGTEEEIREAVGTVRAAGCSELVLLRCQSVYPARPETMRLAVMKDMAEKFGVPVGLSDHSVGSLMAVAAVMSGASVIEKHFCLSRKIKNPDSSFSMEPEEFAAMVRDIRTAEQAVGEAEYDPAGEEQDYRRLRKSIFAVRDIEEGEAFTAENIRVIRPGYGLHPRYYEALSGRHAACAVRRGTPLCAEHVKERLE